MAKRTIHTITKIYRGVAVWHGYRDERWQAIETCLQIVGVLHEEITYESESDKGTYKISGLTLDGGAFEYLIQELEIHDEIK